MIPKTRCDYLLELIKSRGFRIGCEVGLWYGDTFFRLIGQNPGLVMYGVDNWVACDACHHTDQVENRRRVYTGVATRPRARIYEMLSLDAAKIFAPGSLCFVFIDADHSAAGHDILAWRGKIRQGGILCGDDYDLPEVKAAVDSFLPGANIEGGFFWWKEIS